MRGLAGWKDRRKRAKVKTGVGWGRGFRLFGAWGKGRRRSETEAVSAALPDFDCLIDTARHHVGSSLVEIWKTRKHLFREMTLNTRKTEVVEDLYIFSEG